MGPSATTGNGAGLISFWSKLSSIAIALAIGAAGGVAFYLIRFPLPWMLGALTASAIAAILGNRWPMPRAIRDFTRPVVGVLAGASFTPEIVSLLVHWWPALFLVAAMTMLAAAAGFLFFTRLCRFDPVTAYFAAVPGGLSEMSILGASLGASMRSLVLVHAIRIVCVVFAVPFLLQFGLGYEIVRSPVDQGAMRNDIADWVIVVLAGLAGFFLAKRFRFPGGVMVAAMLCSAIVHATGLTHAVPPGWFIAIAQVLIGSVAGSYFAGLRWSEFRSTVLYGFVWAILLLALAASASAAAAWATGFPFETMLVALAPGGTAEMIIVSYAIGANVAFTATCQVSRIFFVLAGAPLVQRMAARRIQPPAPPPPED